MKFVLLLIFLTGSFSCASQESSKGLQLSISPGISIETEVNQKIIGSLRSFLETKNQSATQNKYWLTADFEKFIYPYQGIYTIEQSKFGPDYYKPSLMEIIDTQYPDKKIVKIAFIGHNAESNENTIRCIYNLIANVNNKQVIFSSYIDYATRNWETKKVGNIKYLISPSKSFNTIEAKNQEEDVLKICSFFDCKPIETTYYSCINPVELFQIKGFDYNSMMYLSNTGGLAEAGNIIFSGNNSDFYTHEIVHIYVNKFYPDAPVILNEGIASYLGGSGKFDYQWHKNKFKLYLKTNNGLDFAGLIDNPYERVYMDNETPVPYIIGGVICEKIIKEHGKKKLISLLRNTSKKDVWNVLKEVGITKENLSSKLLNYL